MFVAIGIMLASNCRHNQNVDGGPCSYSTTNYPAVIIEIYQIDSVRSEMILIAKLEGYQDTLYYSAATREYITNQELKSNNFKPGDSLTYQHQQITSGSCNPDIFWLTKERFTGKR